MTSQFTFNQTKVNQLALNETTATYLKTVGLPKSSAPFLSFFIENDEQNSSLLKLTEYFDFLGAYFDRYIVLGSNDNGSFIVIDCKDECAIKILDHENKFSEVFVNSSIEKFANALDFFNNFVNLTIEENGQDSFLESNFNPNLISSLKKNMLDNDNDSMKDSNFWFNEIEQLV